MAIDADDLNGVEHNEDQVALIHPDDMSVDTPNGHDEGQEPELRADNCM
jgi:hypothetical protein